MMIEQLVGKRIELLQQFSAPVIVEAVDLFDDDVILQVRTAEGDLKESFLSLTEAQEILTQSQTQTNTIVDSESFFLFMESIRIKTAFEYDPHFAVSLSGVRPLPHQIEAVYRYMLPQVRLRFLLADDPGAGKTIMAGLLIKELKLRHAIEKILILTPAPLTVQWQDELYSKFAETFEVINSGMIKNQLAGNIWERSRQCIASLDFAKRDEIIQSILEVNWDLVVFDEAHKCSARSLGDELRRTGRYKLAEELSQITERILLLTATPHQGNVDQFHNFLRLLDPEQFISDQVNPKILQLQDSPWFLRRIKEELKDFNGNKLFKERHAKTVPFELSSDEQYLYEKVTKYINQYLGKTQGQKKASVALARTVLQRRLASSLHAIFSSLTKRKDRFQKLIEELEDLPISEQEKRLRNLGRIVDNEQESEDQEEEELEEIAVESSVAEQLFELKEELEALKKLVKLTEKTITKGNETKLQALKTCLEGAEFTELNSGAGKLLIFTEHRDTLNYLRTNLENWGYTVCEIHGGMNVLDRKKAQRDFQYQKQICLATEAAGEGINLQFCQLMINYDLPWNPNRLEQRMGRIHRIGQISDVYIFNFVSILTVEGRVLEKLLTKLEEIRKAMGDKVFDVIGQLLQLNDIKFEDLIREATYNQDAEKEALSTVEKLDPHLLEKLEEATGIALATSHVDLSQIRRTQRQDYLSEEQRLMPRYVEEFFRRACEYLQINLEVRADGLWRIPYLKEEYRSPKLETARRLGIPEKQYPKFTFYKEHLERPNYSDADFISPGHPLFSAIAERLDFLLGDQVSYGNAVFVDLDTIKPYRIHFFQVQVDGQNNQGKDTVLRLKLCAVAEKENQQLTLISSDCLHDFAPLTEEMEELPAPPTPEEQKQVERWLKVKIQKEMITQVRQTRQRELEIRQDYLTQAMNVAIRDAQTKYLKLASKVAKGEETFRMARDQAKNKVTELQERYQVKQAQLSYLNLVRPGRVIYLGTALIVPPTQTNLTGMRNDPEVEKIAMEFVLNYERQRGWKPEDISNLRDGSGFDIRSIAPETDQAQKLEVRRIEVKGRAGFNQPVSLTNNEWRKAQQLGNSYWLYVVYGCKSEQPQLITIQDPARNLAKYAQEIKEVTRYLINEEGILKFNKIEP